MKTKQYIVLDTSFSNTRIYQIAAGSLDQAIQLYCENELGGVRRLRNGRWRWAGKTFSDAVSLIASRSDISFEVKRALKPSGKVKEVFGGIDWIDVVHSPKLIEYTQQRRIGQFREYRHPTYEYVAIIREPVALAKRMRELFGKLTGRKSPHNKRNERRKGRERI